MRIYVASKFEEAERVRRLHALLRRHGHTITYDWTQCAIADRTQAEADMEGVREAEAFVGLFEKDLNYCGAVAEFGMACIIGIPCYLIGHAIDVSRGTKSKCIFTALGTVHQGIESLISTGGVASYAEARRQVREALYPEKGGTSAVYFSGH